MAHQLSVRYISLEKTKNLQVAQLLSQLKKHLHSNETMIRWAIVSSQNELLIEMGIKSVVEVKDKEKMGLPVKR